MLVQQASSYESTNDVLPYYNLIIMTTQLMLSREIITIYCGNYTKYINTLRGQNSELFSTVTTLLKGL